MHEATPKAAMMDTPEGRVTTGDPEPPAEQDSGQPETAEVEDPPVAAPSGAPMPIPEAPAEVEEPSTAEADDAPAEEQAVPAASD